MWNKLKNYGLFDLFFGELERIDRTFNSHVNGSKKRVFWGMAGLSFRLR